MSYTVFEVIRPAADGKPVLTESGQTVQGEGSAALVTVP